MSEHDDSIDGLLRRTLGSHPAPVLSAGFDRRLARRLRPPTLTARGRRLLVAYAVVAIALSVGVLRAATLPWPLAVGALLVPLAVVGTVFPPRRLVRLL